MYAGRKEPALPPHTGFRTAREGVPRAQGPGRIIRAVPALLDYVACVA